LKLRDVSEERPMSTPMTRRDLARSPHPWALALGTCLFAQVAIAAPGPDEQAVPYGVRADPRPIPPHLWSASQPEPLPAAAKSNVFFLNYDGVTIKYTGGEDNSSADVSQFPDFAMTYAPYGDGAKRAASTQAVASDWSKYNVKIVDQRPGSGNYTMCVNSPTNPFGGGVLGIAPLDCNDQQARNIVFAYHSANDQFPAATQATTMSQEIAHAYGLEHVKEPNDVMNPYNAGGDPSFIDQCFTLDAGGGQILCTQQHNMFCQGAQNSHQELVWLFGQSAPDLAAPSVAITFPQNGAMFDAGISFTITVDASDDVGVTEVDIFVNGQKTVTDPSAPYTQGLDNVPAGTYTTYAIARDFAGNQTQSAEVTFTVVQGSGTTDPTGDPTTATTDPTTDPTADPTLDPPTTESDSDSATGGIDTTPTEGGEASGGGSDDDGPDPFESGPALPPDYGQDSEGSCTVAPRPVPTASLMLLVLALVGRRRRHG
jgi:hypothetical protein